MLLSAHEFAPVLGKPVCAGASFTLAAGHAHALVGPNGVGKTSLLRATLGLLPAVGGAAWDGRPVGDWPRRDLARRVAYLPQANVPPAGFTARQLIALGRVPHLPAFGGESTADAAVVERVADRLGVADLLGRWLDTLSGGQLQRVRVGRALAQEPAAVLLDEPDAHLDLAARARLADLIRDLKADGLGVLLASHDLNVAAAVAESVTLLGPDASPTGPPREVLTEANLHAAFGDRVRVTSDPWQVSVAL